NASTAKIFTLWQITAGANQTIDFTIRVAGWQLEPGDSATSLILPPAGTLAISNRAADFAPTLLLAAAGEADGLGTLIGTARQRQLLTAQLAGAGTLNATLRRLVFASARLDGAGTLAASPIARLLCFVPMAGSSSFTADA